MCTRGIHEKKMAQKTNGPQPGHPRNNGSKFQHDDADEIKPYEFSDRSCPDCGDPLVITAKHGKQKDQIDIPPVSAIKLSISG
jgi:hypothetical protein